MDSRDRMLAMLVLARGLARLALFAGTRFSGGLMGKRRRNFGHIMAR